MGTLVESTQKALEAAEAEYQQKLELASQKKLESIEADAHAAAAEQQVSRIRSALSALNGEPALARDAKEGSSTTASRASEDKPEPRKAPAPPSGKKCPACSEYSLQPSITKAPSGVELSVQRCGHCGNEIYG